MADTYAALQREMANQAQSKYRSTSTELSGETYANRYAAGIQKVKAERAENKQRAYDTSMQNLARDTGAFNLQQAKEAWDLKKKQADASGALAQQFLGAWGTAMNNLQSMFGDAGKTINELVKGFMGGGTAGGPGGAGPLTDLMNLMKNEYTKYQTEYAPMEKEFLMGAREMSQAKKGAIAQMTALAQPDLMGAASRAERDVFGAAEKQNQALAAKMMSLGIDPSSGQFGSLMKKGAVQTSGLAAAAMNKAREAEKARAAEISGKIASLASPTEEAKIGLGIREQGTGLLKGAGELGKAQADMMTGYTNAISNLAGAQTNLATGYARAISEPLSQFAGYYMGQAGGAGGGGAINPINIQPYVGGGYGSGYYQGEAGPLQGVLNKKTGTFTQFQR